MNTPEYGRWLYRNLPNAVSVLGVLPIAFLVLEDGARFLIPLMIYNNIMDDLDGQLAVKLHLKSDFGAILDNVCDAVAHVVFVMVVGMGHDGFCTTLSIVAIVAILLRTSSRIASPQRVSTGSATNELMRHIMLVLIATEYLDWSSRPLLMTALALNSVSMLVPYRLPLMIRSLTRSATGIAMVNVSLLIAWLAPVTAPVIAMCFWLPYLYSLTAGGIAWLRRSES